MKREEIEHLAWLARLELKDEEVKDYEENIEKILKYLSILDEVDINIEQDHLITQLDHLRNDEVVENREDLLSVVSNKKGRLIKIPRMG